MKSFRMSLIMSGTVLGVLGPLEGSAAFEFAIAPLGSCIWPHSYQESRNLPAVAPSTSDSLKSSIENNRRQQIGIGRSLQQPIVVNQNTVPISQWTIFPDGWSIWSAEVGSEGALGLRLHIESIRLPKGARLIVYNPAEPEPDPDPITGQTLGGRRQVWTKTLFCSRAIVECQLPPGVDSRGVSFVISGVSHLYALPLLGAGISPKEGTCHNDVTCYSDYAAQASGVARMAFVEGGNTMVCTGCLLAGGDSSQAFFLTANHCVYDQTIASTIEYYWFYQTSSCNGPPPSLGSVPRTGGGADLLAPSNGNDFSFMRLRQSPPSGANPLSWSTSSPSGSETLACIHHPTGAYKRISFGNEIGATANFWGVRWSSGATEPGSSGSPLLNSNHEVIGQLNAGFNGGAGSSSSSPTAPDQFGRFDVTYPAIQQWLNTSSPPPPPTFVKGTYTGLLADPGSGPALQSAGSFSVTVSTKGRFSGRIQMGSARYAMSGQLDYNGAAAFSVPHRNFTGQAQIDPNYSDHITGFVTGGNFTSQMDGDRAVFNTTINPAEEAGRYTVVMPSGNDPSSSPGGASYGFVTVDRLGHIRLSASLADNTKVSQAATLSKDGRWPLYAPLYANHGFVFGWIVFANTTADDLNGQLTWLRPTVSTAKVYPQGFSYLTSFSGSQYVRPLAGQRALNLPDALVAFNGGDFNYSFADEINIASNNRVTNLGNNKLSLSFSPSSGLFHGAVLPPDGGRITSYSGVVFQKQNIGNGYFIKGTHAGYVSIRGNQ